MNVHGCPLGIPAAFIKARTRLTWHEVQFGLAHQLADSQAAIDLAVDELRCVERPSSALLDLAGSTRTEPTRELVEQLAAGEPVQPENELLAKWLYLALAWLYEQREAASDPLTTVEEVYADFEYPEEMTGFVRYMPMDGPDLGSREANEGRLMERWKRYLDSTATKYRP